MARGLAARRRLWSAQPLTTGSAVTNRLSCRSTAGIILLGHGATPRRAHQRRAPAQRRPCGARRNPAPDALHAGADRHQTEHSQNDACAEQQRPRRPRRIRSAQGLPLRRPQPARARRDAWHCRREQARTSAVPHPALRRHSPYAQPRPWPEPWRPGRRRRDGAPEANTLASGLSLLLRPGAAAARARPPE